MEFEQIISECEHPFDELKKIAELKNIAPDKLDFSVIGVSLYVRQSPNEPFLIADDELIERVRRDEEFALNQDVELKERYDIKINTINETERTTILAMLTANKSLSSVEATIKKESIIAINGHIAENILQELLKIKIKHGLLLKIYEDELKREVDRIVKKIVHDKGVKEEYKITLCKYFEPEHVVDAKLIHRYKEKMHKNEDRGKVDFSKRDFAIGVMSGEIVMSYQKPRKGTKGRDCKGRYIQEIEPRVDDARNFTVDSSIKVVESGNFVDYIAQKNGYVSFEGGCYSIKDELEIKELNFKDTGSLLLGVESGMKIKVQSGDAMQDAIGENIKVSVTDIEVKGNIGQAVTIEAKHVNIEGQTHGTSLITAEDAIINVHKGKLKSQKATINRLEGGEIEAEKVVVEQAIGGVIRGEDIIIKQLHSNSYIYASGSIEIHKIIGGENRFFITPLALSSVALEVESLKKVLEELDMSVKRNSAELLKKSEMIKASMGVINDLKNKVSEFKALNRQPPEALSHKLREFLVIIKQLDELKHLLQTQKDRFNSAKNRLKEISESVFNARVYAMQRWHGFNEIRFQSIEPKLELSYIPRSIEKEVYLTRDENDKIVVKTNDHINPNSPLNH